ncbi:OsmC family protein [Nocardioides sp.]|uniref:OsmC family protein n=1 Tax=Nocardioides sp. TaxID=35761 RepID=UPI001A34F3D5|nr:OsmC family protein [Nocardioides sp.]MBJ7356044.1 OsmC family protein [Nocardioides sp.]
MTDTGIPSDASTGPETLRTVDLTIMGEGRYKATNVRGGVLPIGQGEDPDFTPVELLLAALAGCGAIDLEWVTKKRAPFSSFAARAQAHKVRDEQGRHLVDITVTLDVGFPDGEDGDRAREVVPRTLQQVQDRLCTVGRTVALGEPVSYVAGPVVPHTEHGAADRAETEASVGSLPT